MTTKDAFQNALSNEVEQMRNAGYIMNNSTCYDLRCASADKAGKLLAQAKEFLTSNEYEQMLDELAINPLEAAFLLGRLKRQSLFAISDDLLQAFCEEARVRVHAFVEQIEHASPEDQQRLLNAFIEEEIKVGERRDRELPVLLPLPFTQAELRMIYACGDPLPIEVLTEENEVSLEERIEQYVQHYQEQCARLSSGHYHRDRIVQELKDVLEHPDWFLDEGEHEE